MQYYNRYKGIKVLDVWFDEQNISNTNLCNYINLYRELSSASNLNVLAKRKSKTIIIDLLKEEEDLLSDINKNTRYEIRKAKKENISIETVSFSGEKGEEELLKLFENEYRKMHEEKGMRHKSVKNQMRRLSKNGVLMMTYACIEDRPVVFHVYICGDGIIRLLYSVSSFRDEEEKNDRQMIGRANRLLTFEDIIYAKKMRYKYYDFGGYSTAPELANITAFKAKFGGKVVDTYYYLVTSKRIIKYMYGLIRGFHE